LRKAAALLALVVGLLAASASLRGDIYYLVDGDRLTGKTISEAGGSYKIQTPYGRVAIPRGKVAKIVRDDGHEDVVNALPSPSPSPTPAPAAPGVRLVLVITGDSFWQAWSPQKDAATALDPTLRLQLSLDEEAVAIYTDSKVDPEIEGAVVNSFSFAPGDTATTAVPGVATAPAETRPGRITLKLELPAEKAGEHALRLAYQVNEASPESPGWHDVAETSVHVQLKPDVPNILEIHQDRGRMEFSGFGRKRMKNVETFRIEVHPL
jgi:hypothetical protein